MEMLTPEAQISIKLHKNKYQWTDASLNETIDDGRSLLNEVLQLIHPDVQTNVYAELAKIKRSNRWIMHLILSNGIRLWNPSASRLRKRFPEHTMNPSTSWITWMPP